MTISQGVRSRIMALSGLAVLLVFARPQLTLARPRDVARVRIEVEHHVFAPHATKGLVSNALKLTFAVPPTRGEKSVTFRINPNAVQGGAGLVVEHTAPDGTKTTQSLSPAPWWHSDLETFEITSPKVPSHFKIPPSTSFSIWVHTHFDFSKLGIYRISYVHPWAEPEEDPESLLIRSNTLTMACVAEARVQELFRMLRQDTELAFASFYFKHPPDLEENIPPSYVRRKYLDKLDETIKVGDTQDKVLFLLGSPDIVGHDDTWLYETGPISCYIVRFQGGRVVRKGESCDTSDPT